MNEQDRTDTGRHDSLRGSAWAALDETFFRTVQDVFGHDFCAGATALLAANDDEAESDARSAAMRRHPSNFRRF